MALRSRGLQMIDQAFADMQARRTASAHDQEDAQQRYYAQLLSSMPASQRMATIVNNPNWQQSGKVDIPAYQPSELETTQNQLNLLRAQGGIHTLQHPEDTGPGGAPTLNFYNAAGVLPPTELVKKNVAIGTYNDASNLPPEVAQAQKVEDKLSMNAAESDAAAFRDKKYTAIDVPTSAANLKHVGAMTVEQLAAAGNQRAQAGEHVAATGKISKETTNLGGSADPRVANYVTQIRSAIDAGRDASAILKGIPDKKVRQAVNDELVRPENAELYQAASIPPQARSAIAEIDPLIMQARKVMTAYEPYKAQNGLTDRDTLSYLAYRAGKKPPDGSPASELANTQMLGVQAGARLLKGGSRAYQALKMAMQHAPDGALDTRANIYDKSIKLVAQLVNVKNAQLGWSGAGEPPIGAMRSYPNGVLARWDGKGWAGVD